VEESISSVDASLHIPSFTRAVVDHHVKYKKSYVQINVERVIGAVQLRFSIMSATGVLLKNYINRKDGDVLSLDAIVPMCCVLNNLCPGLIPFE